MSRWVWNGTASNDHLNRSRVSFKVEEAGCLGALDESLQEGKSKLDF